MTTPLNGVTLGERDSGIRMRWLQLVALLTILAFPAWAHAEVMDKEPTLPEIWTWAICAGGVGALCWAIPWWLGLLVALPAALFFGSLWEEITDPFVGRAIRAEAGANYVWTVAAATLLVASLHLLVYHQLRARLSAPDPAAAKIG
jgi:hypothetical protein